MANDIVQIDFTNVSFSQFQNSPAIAVTGSLQVDYATSTVTGTLTGGIFGQAHSMSTFTLSGTNPYEIISDTYSVNIGGTQYTAAQFSFAYSGEAPSGLLQPVISSVSPPLSLNLFIQSNVLTSAVVCFAKGTLIRTPRGDAPIETLTSGDVIVTASGEYRSIKWVGHRVIDCRNHPNPKSLWPIRIAAEAIAPNCPSQDLFVSPAHTICIDLVGETLIHAGNLINGATVAQVEVDTIEYLHVELDGHDLVVANNLAAESYLEMANRGFFTGRGATGADKPDAALTHDDFCRPVMSDVADLAFVRRRLLERAEAIGWTRSQQTDLHLAVDGEVIHPSAIEGGLMFSLPASARDVRLASDTFVASDVGGADTRRLGVSLLGLAFISGSETREIALTDPRLEHGFHPEEARDGAHWRWTKGELTLSSEFFAGMSGELALRVLHNDSATRTWIAPVRV